MVGSMGINLRYLWQVNTHPFAFWYNAHTMKDVKVGFDSDKLDFSSELLRALAHPLRMKLLDFIDKNPAINVNKIYSTLKLEQSITSQHLRVLRDAGLVIAQRSGKFIHYVIDYELVTRAVEAIRQYNLATKKK